ncbi:hypothetical protein I305_01333 [Cryptococcus gattii E566]|uniref:High-temperature-induced dauer-formation protein n=1 Tax=Cryptococcus gattii EJB2 TaxID=1296103 RepID=A0ABR5BNZ3_9TREE|nr:hypothetical protein I306_05556 [Cryptococcus gattii EJB2]KIY36472.1 hypothetical protein I305_01333 [Cryptococcus gattii E566]
MFKLPSLPQAIGLPFLSATEDAQLKFKTAPNGVKRLSGAEVIPRTDVAYWAQWYTLFPSPQDVYSLLGAHDIRHALHANPANVATLVHHLAHHLFTLVPSPLFPHPPTATAQDLTKEALNCLRVLGRVLSVVYEAEGEMRDGDAESFAAQYLWNRQRAPPVSPPPPADSDHFTLEDSDTDDGDEPGLDTGARAFRATIGHPPSPPAPPHPLSDPLTQRHGGGDHRDSGEDEYLPSLAERLFSCTVDLLFCAGFTLPHIVSEDQNDKINVSLPGFLLILLSSPLYTAPTALPTTPNPPLFTLTHTLERRLVLSLLCSFLNTSLTRDPADSSGPGASAGGLAGIVGGLGKLGSLGGLGLRAGEERRTLVRLCMSVLLVALDYKTDGPTEGAVMGEGKDENAFRYFLSKLHRKEDFTFILDGILAILAEYHASLTNGYLPGGVGVGVGKKDVGCLLETYILLWRLVDLNKRFKAHLLEQSGKTVDLVVYILVTCLELKDDPAQNGLLRLLSYLLQTLSANEPFGKSLNQTIRTPIPARWGVTGSAVDFMIVSIYSIATTPGLNPLFPALTISIANISPYITHIGVQASARLLGLFKAFSAPNFLLGDEGHPRLVYYLLETFNSVLYHQLNANPNLVYAILRSHNDFQTLATFTLMSGLRDIKRRKFLRAAGITNPSHTNLITRPGNGNGGNGNGNGITSDAEMIAEKAALLGVDPEEEDSVHLADVQGQGQGHASTPGEGEVPSLSTYPPAVTTPTPTTATADYSSNPPPPSRSMSEKARGKMRATESTTSLTTINTNQEGGGGGGGEEEDDEEEELMKIAAAGVGPNGYVPTQEWVSSWQKGLPLDPVLVAISELLPKIQETQPLVGAPSEKVFNILKDVELGDVLPPAPPVMPRRFQWSPASSIWLTSLLWGDIYVAGLTSIGAWKDTQVRLFGIKQAPVRGRGAQVNRVLKMMGVV